MNCKCMGFLSPCVEKPFKTFLRPPPTCSHAGVVEELGGRRGVLLPGPRWLLEHGDLQNRLLFACGDSNYVGRIRSNLTFKVILKVKKAKNAKSLKFWCFFWAIFECPFKLSQFLKIFCKSPPQVVEHSLFLLLNISRESDVFPPIPDWRGGPP